MSFECRWGTCTCTVNVFSLCMCFPVYLFSVLAHQVNRGAARTASTSRLPPARPSAPPTRVRSAPTARLQRRPTSDSVSSRVSRSSSSNSPAVTTEGSSSSIGSNQLQCLPSAPSASVDTVLARPLVSSPVGGRLRNFWQNWRDAGASHKVVRWLRFGYPLPFFKDSRGRAITPPSPCFPLQSS